MPINHIQIDIEPICDKCHWGNIGKCINKKWLSYIFDIETKSIYIDCFYSEEEYQREDKQ